MVHVTHAKHALLRRFTGLGVVPRHCKNTNEENKLHHNGGATGPSQSVGEGSQHQLKWTPLLEEGPAV